MDFLFNGPEDAPLTLALAHGAGGPMDSPFMNAIAEGIAGGGFRVARFEFPYMRARRREGRRGAPDPGSVLQKEWIEAISALGGGGRVAIGGKSLGGRIASMVADESAVCALVCLGYPFHPPGRPEQLRAAHLVKLRTPTLIVQGKRDPFGGPEEVAAYALSPNVRIAWIEDGDHSFKPRIRSGRTAEQNIAEATAEVVGFLTNLQRDRPRI